MARKFLVAAFVVATLGVSSAASAGTYSDDLGKCFVRSTTADDKRALVQWIFAIMALNPSVKPLANITDGQRDGFNRQVGALMQRLFTVDCRSQAVDALKYEGNIAVESSFELLGKAAMSELLADPAVAAHGSEFIKYVDQDKFAAVMKDAGIATGSPAKSPK